MSHAEPKQPPQPLQNAPAPRTEFQFNLLSRPIQDRFVASTRGQGAPTPLAFNAMSGVMSWLWLVLAASLAIGIVVVMVLGWARIDSPLSLQPRPMAAIYVVLGAGAGACLARFWSERTRPERYPYELGTYLFPVGVIVAASDSLRLFPWPQLTRKQVQGRRIVLQFGAAQFVFTLPKASETVDQELDDYRRRYGEALSLGNRRELAVLDPLRDSGFSNPLSSPDSIRLGRRAPLLRYGLLVFSLSAVGGVLFLTRNKLADRALYDAVRARDTVAAYRAYMARGGKRSEVRELLLPIAELRAARGSLERVEAYAEAHPKSQIQDRIDAALRDELLAELTNVRAKGTLAAIDAFKSAHASHPKIAAELAAARHAVYEAARANYVAGAKSGLRVQEFFAELIHYSEQHGPRVELRVQPQVPVSVERADSLLRRSAYFVGNKTLPSQYFARSYAESRERVFLDKLISHLQEPFPQEILHFVPGELVDPAVAELPPSEVPTLLIRYRIEMNGAYTTQSPRGVFVALSMMVRSEFYLPGRQRPFVLRRFTKWVPPDTNRIYHEKLTPEQVYSSNAAAGFDAYVTRVLTVFVPETLDEYADKQ